MAITDGQHFDFIVVGGGTAGNTVAGRLAENPKARILVIEAGAANPEQLEEITTPSSAMGLRGSKHDWAYKTTLVKRDDYERIEKPNTRGKVLGGSSALNYADRSCRGVTVSVNSSSSSGGSGGSNSKEPSFGVFESPKLLMLSGVGPARELAKHGIDVVVDSRHVGQNLVDHPAVPFVLRVKDGSGPLGSGFLEMLGSPRIDKYLDTDAGYRAAKAANGGRDPFSPAGQPHFELDFVCMFGSAFQWHYPAPTDGRHTTAVVDLVRPVSAPGEVTPNSADPLEQPAINLNFFASDLDIVAMREGIRFAYDDVLTKGDGFRELVTAFHPCGTARLSKGIDQGVVDARLRVHGVKRLRVIDASVIPVIPDCRIQNSVYMIGEKGADMIKADHADLYNVDDTRHILKSYEAMSEPVTNLRGVQLPDRYEIRRLGPEHKDWASALIAHANIYQGWLGELYHGEQAKTALGWCRAFQESYGQTIEQNMSYGIFDKHYRFRRPESAATGGALYWSEFDESDPGLEVDGRRKLSDAMDFPLVSVAMAFDGSDMQPASRVFGLLAKRFKHAGAVFGARPPVTAAAVTAAALPSESEPKKEESRRPKWGEVVGRNGTATADAYAGKGLMKTLAHFMLNEAKANGYKRMSVGNSSLAVHHVFANPPAPYTAAVRMAYHAQHHEVEIDGEKVKPFEKCQDVFRGSVEVYLESINTKPDNTKPDNTELDDAPPGQHNSKKTLTTFFAPSVDVLPTLGSD